MVEQERGEIVEIASTEEFWVRPKGKPAFKRGLSETEIINLCSRANEGDVAEEMKPRLIRAFTHRRADGHLALYLVLKGVSNEQPTSE